MSRRFLPKVLGKATRMYLLINIKRGLEFKALFHTTCIVQQPVIIMLRDALSVPLCGSLVWLQSPNFPVVSLYLHLDYLCPSIDASGPVCYENRAFSARWQQLTSDSDRQAD